MIYTVYHHTAYNYSKLARRKDLYAGASDLNTLGRLNLYILRLHKALKMSTLSGHLSKNFYSAYYKRPKSLNSELHAKIGTYNLDGLNKKHATFFKTKPLLCCRADLAYFNLRWYFLNSLKALHLCWNAAKNNKRIAFVAVPSDRLTLATKGAQSRLEQTKVLFRDIVPRLKQRVKQGNVHYGLNKKPNIPSLLDKHGPDNKIGVKSNILGNNLKRKLSKPLHGLSRLIGACGRDQGDDVEQKQNKLSPLLKKQHRLQSLCVKTFVKLPVIVYHTIATAFFSNPKNPFKTVFNHFATACTNLKFQNLQQRLKYSRSLGRTSVAEHCTLQLNHIGLSPIASFKYYDKSTYELKPMQSNLTGLLLRDMSQNIERASDKPLRESLKLASVLQLRQALDAYGYKGHSKGTLTNLRKHVSRSQLCSRYIRATLTTNKNRYHQTVALGGGLKPTRSSQGKAKPKSYGRRYTGLRKSWHKNNGYAKYMMSAELRDFQKFAINPHLKQADVIFFANADKHCALAAEAKRLRIPTIGLVSGLRSKSQYGSENRQKQNDSVDYAILGNPDNSFFVLMVVGMFMSIIRKAASANATKKKCNL